MATATVMVPAEAEGLCGAELTAANGEPDAPLDGAGAEAGCDHGGPPEGAELQDDGSFVQVLDDGITLRWTQRADGTWRKPEKQRTPGSPGRIAAELITKHVEVDAAAGSTSTPAAEEREPFPSEPPEEATQQPDGSYTLELKDRSTLRWTKRPDGTWRRPERKREGWIGDLEQEKYTPPPAREGYSGTNDEDGQDKCHDGASLTNGTSCDVDTSTASKHALENTWCFWVNRRAKLQANMSWAERGILGYEFSTAEDFWCMHHHSFPPSQLENNDCSLFKKGFTPTWEDPLFGCGGRWVVRLEKLKPDLLDSLWLSLLMTLIGEGFIDYGGEAVGGAIVSVRSRTSRIALWITKATDEKRVMAMGVAFRDALVNTTGATDIESKEFVFEDFRTQSLLSLPRPGVTGLTEGIFQ